MARDAVAVPMEIFRDTSRTVLALLAAALLCATPADAKQLSLPNEVPVPRVFSQPAGNVPPEKLGDTPLPEPRPSTEGDDAGDAAKPVGEAQPPDKAPVPAENPEHPDQTGSKSDAPASSGKPDADELPDKAPLPQESPAKPEKPGEKGGAPGPGEAGKTAQPADPRSNAPRPAAMPAEEVACRARLDALGVRFEERQPESDASGCAMPWPIAVKTLGRTIDIAPDALLDCSMAEAAARFAVDVISPAAKATYGEDLNPSRKHPATSAGRATAPPNFPSMPSAMHSTSPASPCRKAPRSMSNRLPTRRPQSSWPTFARPPAARSRPCSAPAAMPTMPATSISTSPHASMAARSANRPG